MKENSLTELVRTLQDALNEMLLKDDKSEIEICISKLKNVLNSIDAQSANDLKELQLWQRNLLQIEESRTTERAKYYIKRFLKSFNETKVSKINDLNMNKWKMYDDIITDSIWVFDRRGNSGEHKASYWGNFIPQIPNQLIRRYTKEGDLVFDPFIGSGTTALESLYLNRNCIGIDLSSKMVNEATEVINRVKDEFKSTVITIQGDSTKANFQDILEKNGFKNAQLSILHPPYWDIINFNGGTSDLSNATTLEEFIEMFQKVLTNVVSIMERKRYVAIVIGDRYLRGEWIPLGFYLMQSAMGIGLKLKSIIVKNYSETRAKRNQKDLWRYRALTGGFYVFKHEYIFLFQVPSLDKKE